MRDSGLDDHAFGAGCGWEVALMADTDDFTVETQGEENFGGRRQQGHDTHDERL